MTRSATRTSLTAMTAIAKTLTMAPVLVLASPILLVGGLMKACEICCRPTANVAKLSTPRLATVDSLSTSTVWA